MYSFTAQQHCLLNLSVSIWRRRGAAKRFGLIFNEETATEVFLLELAEHFPGNAIIVPFTHWTEARTGADWAWGFVGPNGRAFQGMLVQAKRLDDGDRVYREVFSKSRVRGAKPPIRQIDRLISSSKLLGLPPVYAFYNHLTDPRRVPKGSCGSLSMISPALPESWGISIASAIAVRKESPVKTFDRHRRHSRPLHCLLCSAGTGTQGPLGSAGAAAEALSQLFDGTDEDDGLGPDMGPPFRPATELPELFQYAVSRHEMRSTGEEPGSVDLPMEFRSIAGVVIMRDPAMIQVGRDAS